ncbi:MAG: glucokinase [Parahaliea sp.]
MSTGGTRLVADVGGTYSRLALFEYDSGTFRQLIRYNNRNFTSLQTLLKQWLANLNEPPPKEACIAIAAHLKSDRITMANCQWSFSRREFAGQFGFTALHWLNDFESNAWALPHLNKTDIETLRGHPTKNSATLAVLGPGTGLGGASIHRLADAATTVITSEIGHCGMAPGTDEEVELFRLLLRQQRNIHAELLLSGPGLQRLYQALATVRGLTVPPRSAEAISANALSAQDTLCRDTLSTFCGLLGSVSGDFILSTSAYGGLYLAGGIIPSIADFLYQSSYFERLQAKGFMATTLEKVAVAIIRTTYPGLTGAAYAYRPKSPSE